MFDFETDPGTARPDLDLPTMGSISSSEIASKISEVIARDKKTYQNGVRILKRLVELQKKGVNINKSKMKFVRIAQQFFGRQARMAAIIPKDKVRTTSPAGLRAIASYVKALGLSGPSALDKVKLIAGYAFGGWVGVFITGNSAGLDWFKTEYGRSVDNLKQSELLLKALDTLEPKEKQEVLQDLEKQIDTAYEDGKTEGESGGFFDKIQNMALLGLGLFVGIKVMEKV